MGKPMSANMLNRRSYNNLNQESIKEESNDEEEEVLSDEYQGDIQGKPNQLFEYQQQQSSSGKHIEKHGHDVSNENGHSLQLEEEVKFLKLLLQVSYEYMTKMLQEATLSQGVKSELQNVLSLIQNVNANNHLNHNSQEDEEGDRQEERDEQDKLDHCDGNMTMSELQLHQDLSLIEEGKVKQVDSTKHSELVVVEAPFTDKSETIRRLRNLKSSLISQSQNDDSSQTMGGEDTVYSYLEHEENASLNESSIARLSQFKNSYYGRGGKNIELKQSLRHTKQDLQKAKSQLKKEKHLNRQQVDQLQKMQAEIETLTKRWQMTEDKIKSGETMYNILSRTTSNFGQNLTSAIGRSASPLNLINMKGNSS